MNGEADKKTEQEIADYLDQVIKRRTDKDIHIMGAARVGPEYWADAPWRLEPDQKEVPLTFTARDAPDKTLASIEVQRYCSNGRDGAANWSHVKTFNGPGIIAQRYWSLKPVPTIPRPDFDETCPGDGKTLRLKVIYWKDKTDGDKLYEQQLEIQLANDTLPLRDSNQWFYGDTHYHSQYTCDIKEYGNPIADTRAAAEAIGLDWLIVTDHSVDLNDQNPYWFNVTPGDRWQALGAEIQTASDDKVRLLRGEEVTVFGEAGPGSDILHLLVFGDSFAKMIPGAFWPANSLTRVIKAGKNLLGNKDLFSYLFGKIYDLPAVLTGQSEPDLGGKSVTEQGALAFAAHPTSEAQGSGGIWETGDLRQPIHGLEAWNGGSRYHSKDEGNPFDGWQQVSGSSSKISNAISRWDEVLVEKAAVLDEDDNEKYRCVLLAGSDAHGSFNYSVVDRCVGLALDFDALGATDNALGKVRTLLYFPEAQSAERKAPQPEAITAAIREGSCVVTDGPVLNFTASFQGQEATLGQVLEVAGKGPIDIKIEAHSSPEFGDANEIAIVYFFAGMGKESEELKPSYVPGQNRTTADLPRGSGYIRLETETSGADGRVYRCMTNPIWIRRTAGHHNTLHITTK